MDELSKIVQSYQELSVKQTLEFNTSLDASRKASFIAESLRNSAAEAKDSYLKLSLEASQGRAKASIEEMARSRAVRNYKDEKEVQGLMEVECATLKQLAKRISQEHEALAKEANEANERLIGNAKRILGATTQLDAGNARILQNEKRELVAKDLSRKFLLDASSASEASAFLRAEGNDLVRRAVEIEAKSHTAEGALSELKADCAAAEKSATEQKAAEAVALAAVSSYTAAIASSNQQIQALELRKHLRDVENKRTSR